MSQLSDIREITHHNKIVLCYEKNKNRPWNDWLEYVEVFDKSGKQGIVGIMKLKNDNKNINNKNINNEDEIKCIFKISQYINHLVYHEYSVMKGLDKISSYCPHFCRSIGILNSNIEPRYKKIGGNPFTISSKYPIEKEIMLCEYIDGEKKLYNYIRDKKISDDILFSIIKQTMMGINIAQKKNGFTHYDLHSYNIMMNKCDKDVVFLYAIDKDNQFIVPTHGHYPIIIDYGFSFINNMKDGPLWQSMSHTDVGFTSDRFDWVSDPKLFLVTVSDEMESKRPSSVVKKFRRVVKNVFSQLNIDFESGWDDIDDKGASDYVTEILKDNNTGSTLFTDHDHYCIDILSTLIIQPLEEQNYKNIDKAYVTWIKEWIKIENQVSNPFYSMYILKCVVDSAREVRPEYLNIVNREKALHIFKKTIFEKINKISKFCNLKDVHFEKLLCSLLVLAKNIEGVLFDIMKLRMDEKQKEYNKLPLKSIEQIYGAIETNLPDTYVFNENTVVYILNCITEKCEKYIPSSSLLDEINELHSIERGMFIFDKFNESK